jgi:hypothetical protein
MRDAVIVSTAQTPIGKAYRGALSEISGPSSPRMPSPPPSAGQGHRRGDRRRNPGLCHAGRHDRLYVAIAIAAKQIIADGTTVTVGGGVESISLVQNAQEHLPRTGPVAGRPWAIDLHLDARHRGELRRTLPGQPRGPGCVRPHLSAANRGSVAERAVRRGSRPVHRHPAGRGHRTGPVHPRTRRGQSARHHPRRYRRAQARAAFARRSESLALIRRRRRMPGAGRRIPARGGHAGRAGRTLRERSRAPSLVLPEYARGILRGVI